MKYFVIILFVIFMLALNSSQKKGGESSCLKNETIVDIGGCNANGWCGVVYSGGGIGRALLPAIGQKVMVCK